MFLKKISGSFNAHFFTKGLLVASSLLAFNACQTDSVKWELGGGRDLGTYDSHTLQFSELSSQERTSLFEAQKNVYDTARKILEDRYLRYWYADYQAKHNFKTLAEAKADYLSKKAPVSNSEVNAFMRENGKNPQLLQIPEKERSSVVRQYLSQVAQAKAEQSILQEAYKNHEIKVTAFEEPKSPVNKLKPGLYPYNPNLTNAKVTIVEFADYQCPYCVQANVEVEKILNEKSYQGKIQYYFKDFPLTDKHPEAMPAAVATRCAGKQGKYWEMHRAIFNREPMDELSASRYTKFAKQMNLDMKAFAACQKDPTQTAAIDAETNEGLRAGVQGTPTIYINGEKFSERISYENLKEEIDKRMAE